MAYGLSAQSNHIINYIINIIFFWRFQPMPLTYNDQQRRAYLAFSNKVGAGWITLFEGDTEFYSAAYWDLLTHLWRHQEPVRKTDAINAITGVKSPLTASKYIVTALARGLIIEKDNPNDARSKHLTLSPQMRGQMDTFFDDVIDEMCKTADGMKNIGQIPR